MANSRQGIFIVIEGTDGSGKGTQFKILKERLERAGYGVAAFDFPQYDKPSSYFVKRYLNGDYGTADQVGPYTSSLFYALDRYEAAPDIQAALDAGKIVLSNRFTGSSMGHQGTKFDNAEERRGFFIWLDHLEFEMLRIPRPDMSFVLRVPAETAQALVDKKGERSYTDKKRDIHEADLSHLQRAVNVYDDLCQLFPKDFTRIDCVRGDQLLDIDTVQELIWQKVAPLLPEAPTGLHRNLPEPVSAPSTSQPAQPVEAVGAEPAAEDGNLLLEASQLLLAHIAAHRGVRRVKVVDYSQKENGQYAYYTPDHLPPEVKAQYRSHLDAIFENYSQMFAALVTFLQEAYIVEKTEDVRAQAHAILRAVLPVAATTSVQASVPTADADIAVELLGSDLPELRHAGQALAAKAGAPNAAALVTYRSDRRKAVADAVKQYLQDTYASAEGPVRLTSVTPRNEMELVADILYPEAGMSLQELRAAVSDWPYDHKLAVFEAYLGDRQSTQQLPDNILSNVRYNWDLLSDFDTCSTLLQSGLLQGAEWQQPTPRHGFSVPKIIEEAGLTELFEACFDRSLALYSTLQSAGFPLDAQYATLMGHKLRWRVSYDAALAFRLHEYYAAPQAHAGAQALIGAIHQRLAEVHPLLAEAMVFAKQS